MRRRAAIVLALAAPLAVAAVRQDGGVERHALTPLARVGERVRITGTSELAIERVDVRRTVDGRTAALEVPALAQSESARITVLERVDAATDGRVDALQRTFEEARSEGTVVVGEQHQTLDKRSPLEGVTLTVARTPAGFDVRPVERDLEPAALRLLPGLEPLFDAVALLPGEPVAVGDAWIVPPTAARLLMRPFGALSAPSQDPWGPLFDAALAGASGELRARLARVEDGVAHVAVEGTVRHVAREPEGALAARSLALRIEVRAELAFDLGAGAWRALDGGLRLTLHRGEDVLAPGGDAARDETDLEGSLRFAYARSAVAGDAR